MLQTQKYHFLANLKFNWRKSWFLHYLPDISHLSQWDAFGILSASLIRHLLRHLTRRNGDQISRGECYTGSIICYIRHSWKNSAKTEIFVKIDIFVKNRKFSQKMKYSSFVVKNWNKYFEFVKNVQFWSKIQIFFKNPFWFKN